MSTIRYAPKRTTFTGPGAATLERAERAPRVPQWQEGAGHGSFVAHPAQPEPAAPTRIEPGTNSYAGPRDDAWLFIALPLAVSVPFLAASLLVLGIVAAHHPTRDLHPGEWYGPAETRPSSAPAKLETR